MSNTYEVIVERKILNRFVVTARTQHEAAMTVGIKLGGETPFADSDEQEVDRKMIAPKIIADAAADNGQAALEV